MRSLLALLALFATLLCTRPSAVSAIDEDLIVSTACGAVQGAWEDVGVFGSTTRVAEFKGIPYAQAPLGVLRWAPPQPPLCWNGTVRDAGEFGNFCVQPDGSGDEDCLFLNIYIPENVTSSTRVPVFFYIQSRNTAEGNSARACFGGGLTSGSGNFEPLAAFAAHAGSALEGVIVVSLNYRLGMLGFLATEDLSASAVPGSPAANFGLLDQQMALQWVQQNIASFGGDPTRVTVAGQSSGATSIFGLYSSPASKGLFTGAIALSGSINTSMSLVQGQLQNAGVASALGCGNEGSPQATVACMRALPASTIVAAMPACWGTPGMWGLESLKPEGMNYCGLILIDNQSVSMGFAEALSTALIDVPLLMGNMGQENDLNPDVDLGSYTQPAWGSYLESCVAGWNNASMAQSILSLYDAEGKTAPEKAMCDLNTDYGLSCGTVTLALGAKSGSGSFKSPLYIFVNQWAPSIPIPAGSRSLTYAFHTFDYLAAIEDWSGLSGESGWAPGAADLALSQLLQNIWYTFIQTGSLASAPSQAGVQWDSFDAAEGFPANYNTFVFSSSNNGTASGMQVNYKAEQCAMLGEFGLTQPGFWWCD